MEAMSLSYDAVIFDLDGTLADTIPLIVASFNAACAEPLKRSFSHEEVVSRFGIPDSAMLRRELQNLPAEKIELAIENYFQHYEKQHAMVEAFDGISELLQELKGRDIPLAVMTGKGRRTADITLQKLNWTPLFGSVVTGDEVTQQKPHPEGVLRAARELKVVPQNCVFIGDSPADIGAGKATGMITIAALWHNFYEDKLRAMSPDFFVQAPRELAKILAIQ